MHTRTLVPALIALVLLVAAPSAFGDDQATYQRLIKEKVAPVVTVRLVLNVKFNMMGQSGEQELNATAAGVVVDASGLVMLPSQVFDPMPRSRRGRRGGGRAPSITATPVSIRVTFPGDTREYNAVLGAKDSKLGLGFVLIRDLGEKKIATLDMAATVEPAIGQTLYSVSRLGQGFDFAPTIGEAKVTGEVAKPRAMWAVSGAGNHIGKPLYDAAGAIAGIVVNQEGVGERAASRPFLLPLHVAKSTVANGLKKSKAELDRILEEEEEAAAEADADEAKEDADKKDADKKGDAGKKDGE